MCFSITMASGPAPTSLPKTLNPQQQLLAKKGVGRGIGRGGSGASTPARPGITQQDPTLLSAIQNAQMPIQAYKAEQKQGQQYIPGLSTVSNEPNYGPVNPYQPGFQAPKDVPPELIEEFLSGKKNPISSIMEYAAMTKLTCTFREAAVERLSILAKFACVCKVNDREFPQGTGKTKKEAKTAAAKIAFTTLLGLGDGKVQGKGYP